MINRREILWSAASIGLSVAVFNTASGQATYAANSSGPRLKAPAGRKIRVAFVIGTGANVMDTAGPWEAFQDVFLDDKGTWAGERADPAFDLYTVGEGADIAEMTGGMLVKPNYTTADAPAPDIIVVPAQMGAIQKTIEWIQEHGPKTSVTMSICTGAFALARTGLLDGFPVTTHHDYFDQFERRFPELELVRGTRFVDSGPIATAGGLTSGIDLALHIIERYFGQDVAAATANYMEYASEQYHRSQS